MILLDLKGVNQKSLILRVKKTKKSTKVKRLSGRTQVLFFYLLLDLERLIAKVIENMNLIIFSLFCANLSFFVYLVLGFVS